MARVTQLLFSHHLPRLDKRKNAKMLILRDKNAGEKKGVINVLSPFSTACKGEKMSW